jgi:Putative transposase DNA-binding domain/NAD-dependent glycerol-3-phosphate dehydrogenase N-terminus
MLIPPPLCGEANANEGVTKRGIDGMLLVAVEPTVVDHYAVIELALYKGKGRDKRPTSASLNASNLSVLIVSFTFSHLVRIPGLLIQTFNGSYATSLIRGRFSARLIVANCSWRLSLVCSKSVHGPPSARMRKSQIMLHGVRICFLSTPNYALSHNLSQRQMVMKEHKERNKHLNRAVYNDWGLYGFVQMLVYKCVLSGKELMILDERDTSKMCSGCGRKQNMPLYKRTYRCPNPDCRFVMDRDENSAVNILKRYLPGSGHTWAIPCGVRTFSPQSIMWTHVNTCRKAGRTMTIVSILGSSIMGTALSFPLADNDHEVRLVGTHLDRDIIDSIKKTGVHPGLDRKVPETVRAYQLEEAREAFEGAEVALSGVNSFGVRWAGEQLASLLRPGMMVLSIAKGMEASENGDLRILSEVLSEGVSPDLRKQVSWSAIAGPSIAGEVAARRHDTCMVFAGRDADVLKEAGNTFSHRLPPRLDLHRHHRSGGMCSAEELLRARGRFRGGHIGAGGRVG